MFHFHIPVTPISFPSPSQVQIWWSTNPSRKTRFSWPVHEAWQRSHRGQRRAIRPFCKSIVVTTTKTRVFSGGWPCSGYVHFYIQFLYIWRILIMPCMFSIVRFWKNLTFKFICLTLLHLWDVLDLFVLHIPQIRPGQHLKLVVVLLGSFLNHFCFVEGSIILLKEAKAIREYCFNERMYSASVLR